jgi:hypothetical protein
VTAVPPPPPSVPAGWYPNPSGPALRYWDGRQWGPTAPPPQPPFSVNPSVPTSSQPKSPRTAEIWHWFIPGVGHAYAGNWGSALPILIPTVILLLLYFAFLPLIIVCEPIIITIAICTRDSMRRSVAHANEALARGERPYFG